MNRAAADIAASTAVDDRGAFSRGTSSKGRDAEGDSAKGVEGSKKR